MEDRQLYAAILGIESPWRVERVELKLAESAVHVYLEHGEGAEWACAECGLAGKLYDHQEERQWRHLDTCQYQTILHARPPRLQCPEHGVKVARLPWALPHSRFTLLFEGLAIHWLKEASQEAVKRQLGLSWDEVHSIMERAVKRGLERRQAAVTPRIGVDEKSFRRGHRYATIVTDLDQSRVLFVGEGRKKKTLDGFYASLSAEQIQGIEAVAMDMWDAYVESTLEHVPWASRKIVFDKFHVAKHLNEMVDRVRRTENAALLRAGDDTLKGSKYLWLRNPATMKAEVRARFHQIRDGALKTAQAYALKETAMGLFDYRRPSAAKAFFQRWLQWAGKSKLQPVLQVARTLQTRLEGILNYCLLPVTNAVSESLNSKIQWIKYTARGYRNWTHFVHAIYFHCGKLDMMPSH